MSDTIFAQATAPGRAGVAIIRLSGPRAIGALEALSQQRAPRPQHLAARTFFDATGSTIDLGLAVVFRAPRSYTGEDVAELHVHGGRAVTEAIFAALHKSGLRAAERGEFTRRAVENGRLDLTAAEAVADLVDAETEAQRKQALLQSSGALGRIYEGWRQRLVECSALLEAVIDFSDEDLPAGILEKARAEIQDLRGNVAQHLDDDHRGERLREGLYLTVIGPPNAGKSSLINTLARRDVAIVAETAGTTRDVIEVHLDLAGFPLIVADTAGLRDAADAVEAEGVRRALQRAEHADLVLLLLDGTKADAGVSRETVETADLLVWNKSDLPWPCEHEGIRLSLKTADGLPALVDRLTKLARDRLDRSAENPPLTRARHRQALTNAHQALSRALDAEIPELVAEDIRLAAREIGRITGKVDIEEVLGAIFREFCIGK